MTTAVVGPLKRTGINKPRPNPGTIISAIEVNRRVDDQFNPACWICSSACLENCMLVNNRFNPVGLSFSISLSRLLTSHRGLAGGGLQHADYLVFPSCVEDTSARG